MVPSDGEELDVAPPAALRLPPCVVAVGACELGAVRPFVGVAVGIAD
jgi:hypothetical protein